MGVGKENSKYERNTNLESRITAGPITDIVVRALVQRKGFVVIYNAIEKIDDGKYKKSFRFYLDEGSYFDGISEVIEEGDLCLKTTGLNGGLNNEKLYIAHFKPIWPPYKTNSSEEIVNWMYGTGDLDADKDITVDETGRIKEIAISGV